MWRTGRAIEANPETDKKKDDEKEKNKEEGNHYLMSQEELENKIATLTGGPAAEKMVFHSASAGGVQRYRAGDKACPVHDHPVRHEQGLRYGGYGDSDQPVSGRRSTARWWSL